MRLGNDRLRKRYFCECNLSGVVVVVEDRTVSVFVQPTVKLHPVNNKLSAYSTNTPLENCFMNEFHEGSKYTIT